jgi:hypothetical protein
MSAAHTPGPWRVMPCPQHAEKHPFHDHRWIATQDAEVEFGHDPRSWGLSSGSLICEMRDGPPANAHLIASAPALLAILEEQTRLIEEYLSGALVVYPSAIRGQAVAVIKQARGEQS